MKKRIINLLVILALLVTLVPTKAFAGTTLVWPVPGHHTLSQGYHDGNAIDISDGSIAGANVLAAIGGQVVAIYLCTEQHYGSNHDCNGFGTGLAILGDDGRAYNYAHMMPNSIPSGVYYGARVEAGQKIGQVGTTGNSSGYHLHFGISYTSNYWEAGPNPANESYYPDGTIGGDIGENYGDSFYAYMAFTSNGTQKCVSAVKYNVQTQNRWDYFPNQIWHFIRQDSSTNAYKIVNECYGYCLNADNDGKTDGTGVGIWKDNGNSAERWLIMSDGTIQCCNSGLVLGNGSDGDVVLRDKSGSNALHLQILSVYAANGTEYVKPGKPGAVTYSNPLTAIVNESSTLRWNAVAPVNDYDLRNYTVRIYDGSMNLLKTSSGISWPEFSYTFPSVGTYYIQTDAVNTKYMDLETLTYPLTTTGSTTAITVKPTGPVITSQPQSVTTVVGEAVTFTVGATGTNLTYQWQYKTPTGSWSDSTMTGANTASLTVTATAARNGYQYRCRVTDSYGTVATSDAATLTVESKPTITTQPHDISAKIGDTAVFKVVAEGEDLTYQWQYYTGSKWVDSGLTGNKTASLKVPVTAARNGQKYRCVVTNTGGKVTSSTAKLLVKTNITTQPHNISAKIGETAVFKVVATGAGLTYQWQYYTGSSWKDSGLTGNKTASLKVPVTAARSGQKYRCVITDANGKTTTSSTATLTAKVTITTQPVDKSAKVGEKVKFTVKAEGDNLTYRWQYRTSSTGSWKDSGATGHATATLTIEGAASRNKYQYRCVVEDSHGYKAISNAATLTIQPVITSQPTGQIAKAGTAVKFTVKATGAGLTYRWQYKTLDGTWKNSGADGYNTATLTVTPSASMNGYQYRCVIVDANGTKLISSSAVLAVTQ